MVSSDKGNLGSKVFFIWGALCTCCFVYAYLLVWETKGLTLEQVDRMMEESSPIKSGSWVPHSTFAADMGMTREGKMTVEQHEAAQAGEKAHLGVGNIAAAEHAETIV